MYNINDWSFFLVRKFTNFLKKNLLIYIKPSKSTYELKMQGNSCAGNSCAISAAVVGATATVHTPGATVSTATGPIPLWE